jgi:hypothetical protein
MNIQMNEFHSIDIHNITSPSIDEFHEEWTWTCFMDIIDEFHEFFSWHLIGFWLIPKCLCSHHTHINEQNIEVDD